MNDIQRKTLDHLLDPNGDVARRAAMLRDLVAGGVFFDPGETEEDTRLALEHLIRRCREGMTINGLGFCGEGVDRFEEAVLGPDLVDVQALVRVRVRRGTSEKEVGAELARRLHEGPPPSGVKSVVAEVRWIDEWLPLQARSPDTGRTANLGLASTQTLLVELEARFQRERFRAGAHRWHGMRLHQVLASWRERLPAEELEYRTVDP